MKLPIVSGKEVVKSLGKAGFRISRQRGSHIIMVKDATFSSPKITVPVPNHSVLAKGTLNSIIKKAGLTLEKFIELL